VGEDRDAPPGRNVRDRGRHRVVLRDSRLFREAIVGSGIRFYPAARSSPASSSSRSSTCYGAGRAVARRDQWGKMPRARSTALFISRSHSRADGLMGFARSGIRQHWHVWQVMQDTTPYAATPALGYAAIMISTFLRC